MIPNYFKNKVKTGGILAVIMAAIFMTGCADGTDGTADSAIADVNGYNSAASADAAEFMASENGVFEVREKMFATQMTEIVINKENYIGKTLKFEGMYDEIEGELATYKLVYRQTNGCCGTDGVAGLEVAWNGVTPELNDWVEVVGVLEEYDEAGSKYLQIRAEQLNILPERGLEFVTQ
ncbi:MAG: hypothetical protein LBL34_05155 [Clostridiales bacterium]|nr:hypothetical protein [Clostridiales bacterium]